MSTVRWKGLAGRSKSIGLSNLKRYQDALTAHAIAQQTVFDQKATVRQAKVTVQDVVTDQTPNGNSLSLNIDRVTASRLVITPSTLNATLYDAFGQRQVTTLYTQTNQYHVV